MTGAGSEAPMQAAELSRINGELATADPRDIIAWAVERFRPDIALSSSFQTQSIPLLHMISQIAPDLPVVFLDTGYHFPETLAFRDRLSTEWHLNVRVVRAAVTKEELALRHGDDLYRRDPDLCCHIHKVEPMREAMRGLRAWISGVRRDQSAQRGDLAVVESAGELVRVHPLAAWTSHDVFRYMHDNNLPDHPLLAQGYLSIGCAPCTRPVQAGEDERAGRWSDTGKTECGLHTLLRAPSPTRSSSGEH